MYPPRYRLPEVTEHLVALLERRRPGVTVWSASAEEQLGAEAVRAVDDLGRQFREVADDPDYWRRIAMSVETVVVPRYLRMAREQHALEARHYGIWRRGDLFSRAVYVVSGLLLGWIIAATPIPNWLEPIPLLLVLVGPFIPDLQESWAKRSWQKALRALVDDMRAEQVHLETVRPLGEPSATAQLPSRDPDRVH